MIWHGAVAQFGGLAALVVALWVACAWRRLQF